MKISKQDRLLPHLGLLNFEGDAVRAYKKPNGDGFIIVDDHLEIIAEWNELNMSEFLEGNITVTTSNNKTFRYTEEHANAKPTDEKLQAFLNKGNKF